MIVKLSRIAILVLSIVSILSVGCAPVQPPSAENQSYTVTEDGYTLTDDGLYTGGPQANSPASQLPPVTRDLRRLTWEVGPEIFYYRYKEENFAELKGMAYGAHFAFTLRNWLPTSQEQSSQAMDMAFNKWMLRGEARLAFGDVNYEGGLVNLITGAVTPLTIDSVDDRAFEARLLAGPDFVTEDTMFTLFTGIGYRYLHNDTRRTSVDSAAYERESNYLYLPLGVQMTSQLGGGWSWGVTAEVDVFLLGYQRSHDEWTWVEVIDPDADPPVTITHHEGYKDNAQERGYGLRASARLEKKGDNVDIIIEPFIRFWRINESNVDWGLSILEPTNSTLEAGARIMFAF